jgi:hypothetical protein
MPGELSLILNNGRGENKMTSLTDSVLIALQTEVAIASHIREVIPNSGNQTDQHEIQIWAKYTHGILDSKTAEELQGGAMDAIFEAFIGVPRLPALFGNAVASSKIDALVKLLRLNLALVTYLNGEIGEQEYEGSKQSAIDSLTGLIDSTS